MAAVLKTDPSGLLAGASGKRAAREALSGWRPESLPASSGCDSSDCAYCQALAQLRRPGSAGGSTDAAGCWLRRKRSRTDLSNLEAAVPTSSQGEQEPGSFSLAASGLLGATAAALPVGPPQRQGSLWDHALLVEEPVAHSTAAAISEVAAAAAAAFEAEAAAAAAEAEVAATAAAVASAAAQSPQRRPRQRNSSISAAAMPCDSSNSSCDGDDGNDILGSISGASSGHRGRHVEWRLPASLHEVAAFVPPEPYRHRQDIVCALEFEEHGWLLASAGVSKQVRVYSLASCLQHPEDHTYRQPIRCHRMASKISSLAWNPDAPGAVTVADYDGVVSQLDLESGHLIAEADEHAGRRVWSVSHSLQRPHLCASASDDGTVRLWGGVGMQLCLAALRPGRSGAPATSVHLSPFDGDLAAVACADHSSYIYDLRRADRPLWQLAGHARAVSYVRWLGPNRVVTASVDASLAVWQLPGTSAQQMAASTGRDEGVMGSSPSPGTGLAVPEQPPQHQPHQSDRDVPDVLAQPWKRLRGHRNSKNFVGLSVRAEGGLVACGSEASACFAYQDAWSAPLATHSFGPLQTSAGLAGSAVSAQPLTEQFCSAVCWQPATARLGGAPLLAAAMSTGDIRMLELRRPPSSAAARRSMDG